MLFANPLYIESLIMNELVTQQQIDRLYRDSGDETNLGWASCLIHDNNHLSCFRDIHSRVLPFAK